MAATKQTISIYLSFPWFAVQVILPMQRFVTLSGLGSTLGHPEEKARGLHTLLTTSALQRRTEDVSPPRLPGFT